MDSQDSYKKAVEEKRMVSAQEATVRQLIGCTILALTTGWLYYKVQHPGLRYCKRQTRQDDSHFRRS